MGQAKDERNDLVLRAMKALMAMDVRRLRSHVAGLEAVGGRDRATGVSSQPPRNP